VPKQSLMQNAIMHITQMTGGLVIPLLLTRFVNST